MLVMPKPCNECLLSKRKVVSDTRRDALLESCNETGEAFLCHKGTIAGVRRVCHRFFDQNRSLVVRLAKELDLYRFEEIPAK
jgi:hypothetical protein